MKKITFLSFLLIGFLGFSQEFPLDFEDPADDNWGAFNGAVATVVDSGGGDNVLELVSNGVDFDGAALTLASGLIMSDDGNNTITFTIDPQDALGPTEVRTHLFKLEGGSGGPAVAELYFDTTGPDEQSISLDFGAGLGTFSTVVIFADSGVGNTATGTYWIDDIAGGTNAGASCTDGVQNGDETGIDCGGSCPNACPGDSPTPTTPASEVNSIYGDTGGYTNMTFLYNFGSLTGEPDLDPGAETNLALVVNIDNAGYGSGYTTTDITGTQYVHFDYYTSTSTDGFTMFFISETPSVVEAIYQVTTPVLNAWTSVNIPIGDLTAQGFNTASAFQWKVDKLPGAGTGNGLVYLDNIYYSNVLPTLGTEDLQITEFKVYPNPSNNVWNIEGTQTIESVLVYDVLGKQVISVQPNGLNVELNATSLPNGLYFAKVNTAFGTKSIKLIKE